jgi:hypothetical protein
MTTGVVASARHVDAELREMRNDMPVRHERAATGARGAQALQERDARAQVRVRLVDHEGEGGREDVNGRRRRRRATQMVRGLGAAHRALERRGEHQLQMRHGGACRALHARRKQRRECVHRVSHARHVGGQSTCRRALERRSERLAVGRRAKEGAQRHRARRRSRACGHTIPLTSGKERRARDCKVGDDKVGNAEQRGERRGGAGCGASVRGRI